MTKGGFPFQKPSEKLIPIAFCCRVGYALVAYIYNIILYAFKDYGFSTWFVTDLVDALAFALAALFSAVLLFTED